MGYNILRINRSGITQNEVESFYNISGVDIPAEGEGKEFAINDESIKNTMIELNNQGVDTTEFLETLNRFTEFYKTHYKSKPKKKSPKHTATAYATQLFNRRRNISEEEEEDEEDEEEDKKKPEKLSMKELIKIQEDAKKKKPVQELQKTEDIAEIKSVDTEKLKNLMTTKLTNDEKFLQYRKMITLGLTVEAVRNKMEKEGISKEAIDAFFKHEAPIATPSSESEAAPVATPSSESIAAPRPMLGFLSGISGGANKLKKATVEPTPTIKENPTTAESNQNEIKKATKIRKISTKIDLLVSDKTAANYIKTSLKKKVDKKDDLDKKINLLTELDDKIIDNDTVFSEEINKFLMEIPITATTVEGAEESKTAKAEPKSTDSFNTNMLGKKTKQTEEVKPLNTLSVDELINKIGYEYVDDEKEIPKETIQLFDKDQILAVFFNTDYKIEEGKMTDDQKKWVSEKKKELYTTKKNENPIDANTPEAKRLRHEKLKQALWTLNDNKQKTDLGRNTTFTKENITTIPDRDIYNYFTTQFNQRGFFKDTRKLASEVLIDEKSDGSKRSRHIRQRKNKSREKINVLKRSRKTKAVIDNGLSFIKAHQRSPKKSKKATLKSKKQRKKSRKN